MKFIVAAANAPIISGEEFPLLNSLTANTIAAIEKGKMQVSNPARDNIRALGFGAGMGLPNMKKYSDEMDVQTEIGVGTTITMKVKID